MKEVKNLFISALFFLILAHCFAQQPVASPYVKCLNVAPNGDVTITWEIPPDPDGTFVSYRIFSSLSPLGPFTLVDTVTSHSKNFYNHIGASANTSRIYYLIRTFSNALPALANPQDTFSTVFLSVTNVGGNAQLNWNKISIQPISTSSGWYKIYREYPTGNWMFRDSVQNLSYFDIIDVCNSGGQSINYRIEITDNTGCLSRSNEAGVLLLKDNTPPITAPIDTVSVNASNLATISWLSSPSADASSVIIYQKFTGWNPIDTVPASQTFYVNTGSNAGNVSEQYRIAFMDSCGNLSPMVTFHNTIYLTVNFDVCASAASLKWNRYINMNPSVTQYEIYKSINAGPYTLLATRSVNDTSYTDNSVLLGNDYCYMIRATNGGKTSSSNRVCFTANVSQPPQYTYNRFATVVSDKSVQINAYVDPAPGVKYYKLERSLGNSGNFSLVQVLPKIGSGLSFTDNKVSATTNFYSYRWLAMDSCNNVIMTSNTATTMLLKATLAANLEVTLSWNDYSSWLGSVDEYKVYRAIDGVWDPTPIGTVVYTGNGGTFTDDVSSFLTSKGIFSYYVVAIEKNVNVFGFRDSSVSNVATAFHYPKIYVPNAFTPNGDNVNDVFLPVVGFVIPGSYTFMVFDRTSTPVFTTNDILQGWDGKKKGHPCPEGIYMYLVLCKASNGDDVKVAGTISLIR